MTSPWIVELNDRAEYGGPYADYTVWVLHEELKIQLAVFKRDPGRVYVQIVGDFNPPSLMGPEHWTDLPPFNSIKEAFDALPTLYVLSTGLPAPEIPPLPREIV